MASVFKDRVALVKYVTLSLQLNVQVSYIHHSTSHDKRACYTINTCRMIILL